jgi:cytoskeletal protein CcmA (bactofilin family)
MAEVRIKDIDEHEVDTILADDIDFEGTLTFKKPLMIKGKFKGEISSTSALYIGDKAVVEAKVESALVSSRGRIKGDIIGHNRVELASTAHVDGDITTPDFVVESGCKFNGTCNMGGGKKPVVHAAPSAHPPGHPPGQQRPPAPHVAPQAAGGTQKPGQPSVGLQPAAGHGQVAGGQSAHGGQSDHGGPQPGGQHPGGQQPGGTR